MQVERLWRTRVTLPLALAVCVTVMSTPRHCQAKQKKLQLDLSQVSSPYSRVISGGAGRARAPIGLAFLGEKQIAIISIDGIDSPSFAVRQHRERKKLHLTVDFVRIEVHGLVADGQVRFPTETIDPGLAAFPSGRFAVTAGRRVFLYDEQRRLVATKTVEEVCGFDPWPADALYRAGIISTSNRMGALSLSREVLGPDLHPTAGSEGYSCWFSNADLSPIAKGKHAFAAGSARDTEISITGRQVITPNGVEDRPVKCEDPVPLIHDWGITSLLHAVPASAYTCRFGEIRIQEGGTTRIKKLRQRKRGADVVAEAWHAPILAVAQGYTWVGQDGFRHETQIEVFNYQTLKTILVSSFDDLSPPPIRFAAVQAYALSPSGQSMAILRGPMLTVVSLRAR